MKRLSRVTGIMIFLFLIFLPAFLLASPLQSVRVERVIEKLVVEEGFERQSVEKVFADSRRGIYDDIFSIIKKSAGTNYFDPRLGLFSKKSLQEGKDSLKENLDILKKAEEIFGVDKETIVAVLAIETSFGRNLGQRLLFNTFYSLMEQNGNPVLAQSAEKEMIALFVMTRQTGEDIFGVKGSFMGAFGLPQFLPSSFLSLGADGNGDGKIDLFCFPDAIFSAGNYLHQSGYSRSLFYDKMTALMLYNKDRNYALAVIMYAMMLRQ